MQVTVEDAITQQIIQQTTQQITQQITQQTTAQTADSLLQSNSSNRLKGKKVIRRTNILLMTFSF